MIIGAAETGIVVVLVADNRVGNEPSAERVVDLEAEAAAEFAGHALHARFADAGLRGKFRGRERRGLPQQRTVDRRAADIRQCRVVVVALHIADRDLAGERAEQIEVGADFRARAVGVPILAVNIDRRVVDAGVFIELDKRLEIGIDLVAEAKNAAILVEGAPVEIGAPPSVKVPFGYIERSNVSLSETSKRPNCCATPNVAPTVVSIGSVASPNWMFGLPGLSVDTLVRPSSRIWV